MAAAANIQYNANRTAANVTIRGLHKSNASLSVAFNGVVQPSAQMWKVFSMTDTRGPVNVTVLAADGATISLEPLDFIWNAALIRQRVSWDA